MKGMSVPQAPKGNEWLPTVKNGVAAAGANIGSATAIPAGQDCTVVTSGTGGVNLPSVGVGVGETYQVANHTGAGVNVYPGASAGTMGTASAGAAYSLSAGKMGYFTNVGPSTWTVNP